MPFFSSAFPQKLYYKHCTRPNQFPKAAPKCSAKLLLF